MNSTSRPYSDGENDDSDSNFDLICFICHKPYRNPRLFPCNHYYCSSPRKCIAHLIKNRGSLPVECPRCGQSSPYTTEEDFILYEEMEMTRNSQSKDGEEASEASNDEASTSQSQVCSFIILRRTSLYNSNIHIFISR